MKHQIRRLPVHRNATVMAAVGATATALVALLMAIILPFARSQSSKGEILFWLILVPFIYALVFDVCMAVTCAVYNLIAERRGGFELELTEVSPTGPERARAGTGPELSSKAWSPHPVAVGGPQHSVDR